METWEKRGPAGGAIGAGKGIPRLVSNGGVKIQIRALYQTEGYRVEKINTDGERAQVNVVWDERCRPRCTTCGQTMRINRKTPQSALDLPLGCASVVMLLYEAVQGFCTRCAHYQTVRPLEIVEHHRATRRLLRHVSLLCRWLPTLQVCQGVPITPATAWRYDRFILQTELPEPNLEGLEAIIIDEKHLGKSGFITQVLNARTGELLYLAAGRGQDALAGFFAQLSPAQKAAILAVALDRSGGYRAAVERHLPQADIVLDKFHLIANYHEVIDQVRRRTYREADLGARSFIKGQRYNLFRNPQNLSATGRTELKALLAANEDLHLVYLLKDYFKQVWTYTYRRCAEKTLEGWIAVALDSGVRELARFAKGLAEVKDEILSFCKHRLTSAKIEAFNNIVSRVIHKACGVSNLDYLSLKLRQESLQR
jgi:transposase